MTYGRRHYITQQVLVRLAYAGPSGSETREFLKAFVRFILVMTLVFFGLAAVSEGAESAPAQAQMHPASLAASAEAATTGEFLYRVEPGGPPQAAPSVDTRVRFDVTGVIARATVIQRFRNPLDEWVEGVYVFPLPESAAVDHLRMRVGTRVIEGQIREKEQARREYAQAAAEGRRATLLEQQRPNLFTSRVANLGPLEELEVEIEYQQSIDIDEDRLRLRFPLALTPRHTPGIASSFSALGSSEFPAAHDFADELILSPPFLPPSRKGNPVSIELNLNAGFEVASLTCDTHPLVVETLSARSLRAHLRDKVVPSDRDFEVTWKALPGVMPQSSLATEEGPDGTYVLVTLFPPTGALARSARIPREVTFVIDTSGSMAGASILQAKKALGLAIDRLDPADAFEFNSATSTLFPEPVPATTQNRARAARFVLSLAATGGTEMLPALLAALLPTGLAGEDEQLLKQVIFLTDGAVANEDQLFAVIKSKLGRARLFTIGIGSAPNAHFMTRAAEFGRGTFTFISDLALAEKQMTELYAKVESPVLSDIQVSFDGVPADSAEMWPGRIPDLYLGEPVVLSVRFDQVPTAIRVTGRRAGEAFETVAPLELAEPGHGIGVLWARRKIQSLLDGVFEGDDADAVRAQVISLGLAHHLVTKHTSLVAVDVTSARPADEGARTTLVPLNIPDGSTSGSLPRSATPATLYLLQGLAAGLMAASLLVVARRS